MRSNADYCIVIVFVIVFLSWQGNTKDSGSVGDGLMDKAYIIDEIKHILVIAFLST